MNDKSYRWILYTITIVIAFTIGIQVYWNYQNYQQNKQQVLNDIQESLDKAVENYYSDLSKENFLTIVNSEDELPRFDNAQFDSIFKPLKTKSKHQNKGENEEPKDELSITSVIIETDNSKDLDSINTEILAKIFDQNDTLINKNHTTSKWLKSSKITQLSPDKSTALTVSRDSNQIQKNLTFWGKKASDSLKLIKGLSAVFIALQEDSINYKTLDSMLVYELKNKGIENDFYLNHLKNEDTLFTSKQKHQPKYNLKKSVTSTYLKRDENITLNFKNPVSEAFKRSTFGIALSTMLIIGIISCLFYLLKIIKHQKQLAEVKNDLISNITHEFKTPIATIGVALESINNFNAIEDKGKTKKYISMSSEQLGKLNIMVEKLLETATLDSDNLELNKESTDIVALLNSLTNRYKVQFSEREFNTSFKVETLEANIDIFHFENAMNNILDNAIKYGGQIISIDLIPKANSFDILISDNGNNLSKENKERIFEKFYRVPKGNTHDVKGFGIGLYYTKTIIEKHNGSINLDINKNLTTFKITLPNG